MKGQVCKRVSALIFSCIVILSIITTVMASGAEQLESIYKSTGDYIASLGIPTVGSAGGEWVVIGLARSGRDVPTGYYDNVVQYVRENINEKEQLHRAKSTDNARVILALTAIGCDVTDVDGHNLLMGLTDMTYVKKQGINGPIWALIALDSHGYAIPANDSAAEQVTREALITYILDAQLADGGWALFGTSADPDITAMALQALAPYYSTDAAVNAAVDHALDRLSALQADSGGYGSWGSVNSESCAQVIVALTALGIDPHTDARFIKNGCSVLDALAAFSVDGGFCHVMGGGVNGMATEQSYYALAAYYRFTENKTSLYDMRDVKFPWEQEEIPPEDTTGETTAPAAESTGPVTTDAPETESSLAKTEDKAVQSPPTGDGCVIYAGVLLLSVAGLAVTVLYKSKEKQL